MYGKFEGTIEQIKQWFAFGITRTSKEMFNGRPAEVTRTLSGCIHSVNTGATTLEKAREHMGLNISDVIDIPEIGNTQVYGREYVECGTSVKDYFAWNPENRSMYYVTSNLPKLLTTVKKPEFLIKTEE